jgi:hypothetical protein
MLRRSLCMPSDVLSNSLFIRPGHELLALSCEKCEKFRLTSRSGPEVHGISNILPQLCHQEIAGPPGQCWHVGLVSNCLRRLIDPACRSPGRPAAEMRTNLAGGVNVGEDLAVTYSSSLRSSTGRPFFTSMRSLNRKILGIDELQFARSITHDELFSIMGEPPALALIGVERRNLKVSGSSTYGVFLPTEHPQLVVEDGDALGKKVLRHRTLAQHLAVRRIDFADVGIPIATAALEQPLAREFQPWV